MKYSKPSNMKTLVTLACMLGGGTSLFAQPASYVPTNGLMGWWPFNGNANDESANGNDGAVNGPLLGQDRLGNSNAAYVFAGGNDRINVANNLIASSTMTSYSISVWFQSQLGTSGILVSDRSDGDWSYKYAMSLTGNLGGACRFSTHDGGSLTNDLPSVQAGLNNNAWTHLVAVLDMSVPEMRLFVNGALDTVMTVASLNAWNPTPTGTVFGNWLSPGGGYLNPYTGVLDDIGVWDRVLTTQEILGLFNAVGGTPCVSPLPVSFSGLAGSYMTSDGPATLIGTPANGVFIGPGIMGSTFHPAMAGVGTHGISYVAVDTNGCVNSYALCTEVMLNVGIQVSNMPLEGVRVFPNPGEGLFTIELDLAGLVSLQVFDTRGRVVHNEVFQASGGKTARSLDLSAFAKGTYTLRVQNGGNEITQRVVME